MKNESAPNLSAVELNDMRKYMPKGYLEHYEADWASSLEFANVGTEAGSGKWAPLYATQALDIIANNISAGNQQSFIQGVAQLSSYIKFGIIDGRCPENNPEVKEGLEKINRAIGTIKAQFDDKGELTSILRTTIGNALKDLIENIKKNKIQTSYLLHLEQCRDLCIPR